jgi:undecaprenyl-phosphate 4-deoxy-4-formamido-L-arabinose transferase
MKKISIVIPCYNSEKFITQTVSDIENALLGFTDDYEIILVSDASPDNVFSVIKKLARENPRIRGFELSKNFGQHAALLCGFGKATGDIIIAMDDDGQTDPSYIPSLIEKLEGDNLDIVFAKYEKKKHNFVQNLGSKLNSFMQACFMEKPKGLYVSSFFATQKFVAEYLKNYNNNFVYFWGLFYKITSRIGNVTVQHKERAEGKSGYSFFRMVSIFLNGFVSYSVKPLRFATLVGIFSFIIGVIFSVTIVLRRLVFHNLAGTGWASTICILLVTTGLIMFMLGIIGEYIGRSYINQQNFPQFVIREETKKECNE